MFKHAYGICHVKDSEGDPQNKGVKIDLRKTFDIPKSSGYRGYCSIEYDGPGDPHPPTARLVELSVKYLS